MASILVRLDPGEQQGRVVDVRWDSFDWNIEAMNKDPRSPAQFGVVILDTGAADTVEDIKRARRVFQERLPIREEETRDKRGAFRLTVTRPVRDLFSARDGVLRVPQDVGRKQLFQSFRHRDSRKDLVRHVMDEEQQRGVALDEDTVVERLFEEDRSKPKGKGR